MPMPSLDEEARAFQRAKRSLTEEARQQAAFFLMCGIDLAEALAGDAAVRERTIRRLERLIERERLKGMRRHWSYDLNRHIALKQALDRLRAAGGAAGKGQTGRHGITGPAAAPSGLPSARCRIRRRKTKTAPEGAA